MSAFLEAVAGDLPGLLNELGQDVDYTPSGQPTRPLRVIIGRRTVPVEFENLQSDGEAVWIRTIAAYVPDLAQGDQVQLPDGLYTVDGLDYDRAGTVLATLIRA